MASFEDIKADFEFLEDWDDRYKYLIDLGRNLTPYPEQFRDDAHKVRGCASQVWLHAERKSGIITLEGDSDAHIVKGARGAIDCTLLGQIRRSDYGNQSTSRVGALRSR